MAKQTLGVDPGEGIAGVGTTIEGATQGPIGMVTRIQLAGQDVSADLDITTMNSPDKWMVFIAALRDAKEANLDLLYEAKNMALVLGALGQANEAWTITFPDGSDFVCQGYIKHLGTQIPVNDKISQTANIRFSGKPVFTPAS